ncbi:MAG TPA: hypothetical protein VFC78_14235 [Tepidisphaeraceae bacterium]|nr:hypothetical protein [Tepidisphaeraceae bacterium]
MESTNGESLPKQGPPSPPCPQCRGSGLVVLLTSAGPCTACGGTGIASGIASGPETPVGPVNRKFDERGRLVSQEWVTGRYHLERRYDAETGRLIQESETCLDPGAGPSTTYSYR